MGARIASLENVTMVDLQGDLDVADHHDLREALWRAGSQSEQLLARRDTLMLELQRTLSEGRPLQPTDD